MVKESGCECSADVVPYAEDGTGNGSHRIGCEVGNCQGGSESGVLHADFDADSHTLGMRKAEQSSGEPSDGKSEQVVEHNDDDDKHSADKETVGIVGNDYANNYCYHQG